MGDVFGYFPPVCCERFFWLWEGSYGNALAGLWQYVTFRPVAASPTGEESSDPRAGVSQRLSTAPAWPDGPHMAPLD